MKGLLKIFDGKYTFKDFDSCPDVNPTIMYPIEKKKLEWLEQNPLEKTCDENYLIR